MSETKKPNKLEFNMNRFGLYAIYTILALTCINSCNSCQNTMSVSENTEKIESLDSTLNKTNETVVDKPTIEKVEKAIILQMEIEGLRTSKRTLYDENAIIRTTIRPDDKMNEYDELIAKKEEELKALLGK